jgi:hypothetical protein
MISFLSYCSSHSGTYCSDKNVEKCYSKIRCVQLNIQDKTIRHNIGNFIGEATPLTVKDGTYSWEMMGSVVNGKQQGNDKIVLSDGCILKKK